MIATSLSLAVGCGPARRVRPLDTAEPDRQEKMTCEAYLFDARLYRQGKRNSFRLELFRTDSIMAMAGRGYLGKGALKGWLTADSIEVYFPSTDEYLYESVDRLLSGLDCADDLPAVNLLSYFTRLPSPAYDTTGYRVRLEETGNDEVAALVAASNCSWQLTLAYKRRSAGWRLESFEFDDGADNRLTGRLRERRERAKVKAEKFRLTLPEGAIRITR
jgi:hypothetical protein